MMQRPKSESTGEENSKSREGVREASSSQLLKTWSSSTRLPTTVLSKASSVREAGHVTRLLEDLTAVRPCVVAEDSRVEGKS